MRTRTLFGLGLTLLAFTLAPAPSAHAQGAESLNDLRRENERLREEVSRLEAELVAARDHAERLRNQNNALRESLKVMRQRIASGGESPQSESRPSTPVLDEEETAVAPEAPMASPESLFLAVQKSYEETLADKPRETETEIRRFLGDARRWVRTETLRHRGPVRWIARVDSFKPEGREAVVEWRSIDPVSGLPYGETFTLKANARDVSRLGSNPEGSVWELDGVVTLDLQVNDNLAAPSVFSARRMVGPYVEYGFTFDARSMTPVGDVGKSDPR